MDNLFYCYSKRLNSFLISLKFTYVKEGKNFNSNRLFWCYERTEKLNRALKYWEDLKKDFNL